jgi:glyoxylase-like metal-dependent hydrolase (beta-lactamase superfamily II)
MSDTEDEGRLVEVGDGCFAWLAGEATWGMSNAGLVAGAETSLLVDTLFDLRLTRRMLDAMEAHTGAAPIGTVVNTHANGDHCHGNQLVRSAEIIASKAAAEEMAELPPSSLAALQEALAEDPSPLGRFFRHAFGAFTFAGIEHVPPTRTFEGAIELQVGDKRVEVFEVGPAHTRGDVLVHVPGDRAIFTGDILFVEGTPIIWAGPVDNWLAACDCILSLDAAYVVPGHGPITDRHGVEAVKAYLAFVSAEARQRFDAGMSSEDAARDIDLGAFADWSDSERIAVNVHSLYREFGAQEPPSGPMELFRRMAELARL